MKNKNLIWIIVLLLFVVPTVYADGSIWTGVMVPQNVDICGEFADTATVSASQIWNMANVDLENVQATLIFTSPGILLLTEQNVGLGNMTALGQSTVEPSWTIKCNPAYYGESEIYIEYSNNDGNLGSSINEATSHVNIHSSFDLEAPLIIDHGPKGSLQSSYAILNVTTNEDATCKYNLIRGTNYENMVGAFSTTGTTYHEILLGDLNEGLHTYYIKCQDKAGNKNQQDYVINFQTNAPPSARIILNKQSPIAAGRLDITLSLTEDVLPRPILKYSFDGASWMNVPLEGTGNSWKGFILINEADNGKVGEFQYSGIDLSGNNGNIIISGGSFFVDSAAPEAPTNIAWGTENSKTVITWEHSGKDVSYYTLYRSTKTPVTEIDNYQNVTNKQFKDSITKNGTIYYYRVSASDTAGNQGALSDEIIVDLNQNSGTIVGEAPIRETAVPVAVAPVTTFDTEALKKKRDELKIEIGLVLNSIKETNLLNYAGFKKKVREGKTELTNLKNELEIIEISEANSARINEIENRIKELKGTIPKKIVVNSNDKYWSGFINNKEDLGTIFDKLAGEKGDSKDKYVSQMTKLKEKIEVNTNVDNIAVTYLDNSEKEKVVVTKEIFLKDYENFGDLELIEILPKGLIADANSIEVGKESRIIEQDPIIGIKLMPQEKFVLEYVLNDFVDVNEAKNIHSVFFEDFDEITNPETSSSTNKITGLSVVQGFFSDLSFYNLAIIFSVILIFGLGGYYFFSVKGRDEDLAKEWVDKKKVKGVVSKGILKPKSIVQSYNYPNYAAEDYRSLGLVNLKDINLCILLNQAHKAVNMKCFDDGIKLYHIIKENFNELTGSMETNELIDYKKQIERLHKKISLWVKIQQAKTCAKNEDYMNLRYILNDVAKDYNDLLIYIDSDEITFLDSIKYHHVLYSNMLINQRKKG